MLRRKRRHRDVNHNNTVHFSTKALQNVLDMESAVQTPVWVSTKKWKHRASEEDVYYSDIHCFSRTFDIFDLSVAGRCLKGWERWLAPLKWVTRRVRKKLMYQKEFKSGWLGIWIQTLFQRGGLESRRVLSICRNRFEPKRRPHRNQWLTIWSSAGCISEPKPFIRTQI